MWIVRSIATLLAVFWVCTSAVAADRYPLCGPHVKVISLPNIDDYYPHCQEQPHIVGVVTLDVVIELNGHVLKAQFTSTDISPPTAIDCARFLAHREVLAIRYSIPEAICHKAIKVNFSGGKVDAAA